MTLKGNTAALPFLQPTQRVRFAMASGSQLARGEGKAVVIPLKERNGGRTRESHRLSPPRADTRSRMGRVKLKMHLCKPPGRIRNMVWGLSGSRNTASRSWRSALHTTPAPQKSNPVAASLSALGSAAHRRVLTVPGGFQLRTCHGRRAALGTTRGSSCADFTHLCFAAGTMISTSSQERV